MLSHSRLNREANITPYNHCRNVNAGQQMAAKCRAATQRRRTWRPNESTTVISVIIKHDNVTLHHYLTSPRTTRSPCEPVKPQTNRSLLCVPLNEAGR